jgi:hypothetical protein
MQTKAILVAAIAAFVVGCVPETVNYYAPSASSGVLKATHGRCNDVKDRITFVYPDNPKIDISISALTSASDGEEKFSNALSLTVGIGREYYVGRDCFFDCDEQSDKREEAKKALWQRPVEVRLADDHLAVVSPSGERVLYALDVGKGAKTPVVLTTNYVHYGSSFSRPPGDYFVLEFPDISFNGIKFAIPPVRYAPRTVRAMAGINC